MTERAFVRGEAFYDTWQQQEGIPIYKVFHVDNLEKVKLEPWHRFGGNGAFINLADPHITAAAILEIPPGKTLKAVRHLFETWVFVVAGHGKTTFEQNGYPTRALAWKRGSLFGPPLNVRYQHQNSDPQHPARLLMVSNAPLTLSLYHNEKYVFDNPFVFDDRYKGQEDFFSPEPAYLGGRVARVNFIPDTLEFQLMQWKRRGIGAKSFHLSMSDHTMAAHLSEFEVGTYKKGHRHGPGAHVIILRGSGYSLLWQEGKDRVRVDWKEGSMFAPPEWWYHQHFNTGRDPARYLALRRGGSPEHRLKIGMQGGNKLDAAEQIEYKDEDPAIYKTYKEELQKNGIKIRQMGG
ncbi:MAG: ethanolamine ammonia lyase-activating protein [Candidatus Binatia bacterium]